jgi:predicted PurR-regulated permease PerM
MSSLPEEVQQKIREFRWDTTFTPAAIGNTLSGLGNTVATLISDWGLILLFMMFILTGQGQFRHKVKIAFPPDSAEKVYNLFDAIYHQCRKYIIAVTLFNILSGSVMTVILMIFGVDLALFWGLLTFLLCFIPSIGSIFSAALPIIVSFLQFEGIGKPFLIGITVISTQLFIGSYLAPRVMGNSLNISPLLILVSLIFWGWVWGPWGMVR